MKKSRRLFPAAFADILIACAIVSAAILGAIYLLLATAGLAWTPSTCVTEVHDRVSNPSGFDFEISETDCDTLAKTAAIGVLASRHGRTRQVLLFKFFPAALDLFPTITSIDRHTVPISIPAISSLAIRRDKLQDLDVNYKIDVIDYPDIGTDDTRR